MNPLEKFINLTICEVSLDCFEEKHTFFFKSYLTYCSAMNLSLKDGKLSKRETTDIMAIMDMLDKIYSMTAEENGFYIAKYFAKCDYELYENNVRLTRHCFPNSHD